jgi:hypothetical protein
MWVFAFLIRTSLSAPSHSRRFMGGGNLIRMNPAPGWGIPHNPGKKCLVSATARQYERFCTEVKMVELVGLEPTTSSLRTMGSAAIM